jgi:hypothetical protein
MENIFIFDNFLNENELNKVVEIINTRVWGYGHTSGYREQIQNVFFSTHDLDEFFSEYIKEKIEKTVSRNLKINRLYTHIQTFGQDGSYHIDCSGDNKYTFCIYLNYITEIKTIDSTLIKNNKPNIYENMGGEFFIKIPDSQHILSIDTIMNRGVFFPSNYLHKGMAYNRFIPNKRVCITWKLEVV